MHTAEQDGEQGEDHFAGRMHSGSYLVLKTVIITRVTISSDIVELKHATILARVQTN